MIGHAPRLTLAAAMARRLALEFERRGERSVLAAREHDGPARRAEAAHPEGDGGLPCDRRASSGGHRRRRRAA
jgi:hypothetical protein